MSGPSFAVVCTTVHDGSFLKHYAKALEGANAVMYVIPDRKTPKALYDAVREYKAAGLEVSCPDPISQADYTLKLGAPDGFFPWDTDHRRNVGYLMAYESGADIVISIDDDNLPQPGWLADHAEALTAVHGERAVRGVSGGEDIAGAFFDPCHLLDLSEDCGVSPVTRGVPRGRPRDVCVFGHPSSAEPAINEGLWLGDPDVDAISRLALQPVSVGLRESAVLSGSTWAPVNSQNTAVRREVIPAYYFFRSPRFGDIYQGYLAQACAKHLGHAVRFGTPVVRHERNDHDLLRDLEVELPDIMVLDDWLDWLTSARPIGNIYAEAYESLAEQVADWAAGNWRRPRIATQMHGWLKLCRRIG